ncbi:hypothetical protein BpHYR1_028235 [Brachionus plicatilis]|uniref:Uncharacterized protein n=1 Tax=Brachionus plicatilis TaxID=10195 RepID=A0A3M7R720_BRAPC|nr:hypothetical protein BpHYR1_028235 [Brachionus plicatilis]
MVNYEDRINRKRKKETDFCKEAKTLRELFIQEKIKLTNTDIGFQSTTFLIESPRRYLALANDKYILENNHQAIQLIFYTLSIYMIFVFIVFGPYLANGLNNDAKNEEDPEDLFILDRGFRDCLGLTVSKENDENIAELVTKILYR